MQQPSVNFFSDKFTGNGVLTAFTLSNAPVSAAATAVYVSGVRQEPVEDYTVSGTTLTFAAPPGNTLEILAIYGNAGAADVADLAITTAKIANDAVTLAKLAPLTANRLLGSDDGGNPSEVALGNGVVLSGTSLVADIASQAQAEAETANKIMDAAAVKYNPGVAKSWCVFNGTNPGPISPTGSYNVVDVTDNGVGDYTVNIDTDMSGAAFPSGGLCTDQAGTSVIVNLVTNSVGSITVITQRRSDNVNIDPSIVCVWNFGDFS